MELLKEYFESGKLRSETMFKEGAKDGLFVQYYESGQRHKIGTFKNWLLDGRYTEFWEDGMINWKPELYKNGIKQG